MKTPFLMLLLVVASSAAWFRKFPTAHHVPTILPPSMPTLRPGLIRALFQSKMMEAAAEGNRALAWRRFGSGGLARERRGMPGMARGAVSGLPMYSFRTNYN